MRIFTLFFFFLCLGANSSIVIASDYYERGESFISADHDNTIEAGEFYVDNNGVKIWYKVSGEGPVCIFPSAGWGPGSELYYNSMSELESFFTMIYLDTRGTGKSDRPPIETYTTKNILSDLEAVRKNIHSEEIWLIGHSKGGALVLNYAHGHPGKIRGIILIDASGGINTPPEIMQKMMMERQNESWFAAASEYFKREPRDEEDWITGTRAIMPMYFSSTVSFLKNKEEMMKTSLSYDAFLGQKYWYDCENNLQYILPKIDISVLIVVGMDDFICGPYVAKDLHFELNNSKLLPIKDAGHFPWMEQPDQFYEGVQRTLCSFLSQ
jgi:proline iminopeptidase